MVNTKINFRSIRVKKKSIQKSEIRKNVIFSKLLKGRKFFKLKYQKEIPRGRTGFTPKPFQILVRESKSKRSLNLRQQTTSLPSSLAEGRLGRPVLK